MSDATAKAHIPSDPAPSASQPRKKRRGRRPLYTRVARRGRRSREKGAEGEREVAALAREEGFASAKRSAPMQAGHAEEYEDVAEVGRLAIESKRYKRTPVNGFARKHLSREIPGFVPVLAYRDDHQPEPYAVIRLRDLLRLERQALGNAPPCNGWDAVEAADREAADDLRIPKDLDAGPA